MRIQSFTNKNIIVSILICLILCLHFSPLSYADPANFTNPSPYNHEDAVFTDLSDDGVNVTLNITWIGSGTKDIQFYWGNATLIGTDTGVASGTVASIYVPYLDFVTAYTWYAKTSDNSDTSHTYHFNSSDVFVVQRRDPNVTPYAWIKCDNNPTLPVGDCADDWDKWDKEGTTAFYDNVTGKFVILYGGAPYPTHQSPHQYLGVGVAYAYNVTDLQESQTCGYETEPLNPVIDENMTTYTGGALGIYDDRLSSGKVILYSKTDPAIWYNDDGNWSNWTYVYTGRPLDDVEKIGDTYIGVFSQYSPNPCLELYYSDDPITGWVADSNNPVFLISELEFGGSVCTAQIFTLWPYTESNRLYVSFETYGGSGVDESGGAIAYCLIDDILDGDNSSTWWAGANGYEFAVGGIVNIQSWECSTGWGTAEHKTVYFHNGDPRHVYVFFESQCASWSQVGTAYTRVYGPLYNQEDDPENIIEIVSINGVSNGSATQHRNRTFNWTKVNYTLYYQLQISNSSDFSTLFVNLTDINETNYVDDYTEYGDYVEFILPDMYNISWYGYHYYRVRAYTI